MSATEWLQAVDKCQAIGEGQAVDKRQVVSERQAFGEHQGAGGGVGQSVSARMLVAVRRGTPGAGPMRRYRRCSQPGRLCSS
ncbi:hypothetical protein AOLI_G00293120 [Acnodon oligacanthus]